MSENKNITKVVEINTEDPSKLLYAVDALTHALRLAATTAQVIHEDLDEKTHGPLKKLAGAMAEGLLYRMMSLMEEIGAEVDMDDPEVQEAIVNAREKGELVTPRKVKEEPAPGAKILRPNFTFNGPGSNEVH